MATRISVPLLAVAALAAVLTGCGTLPSEGAFWTYTAQKFAWQDTNSSQSAADRMHTQRQVIDEDARALVDDIDFILLRERPSRLSRWHNR